MAVEDDFAFCGDDLALIASPDSWLSDSACTSHIAQNKSHFITYMATPGHKISGFGNVPGLGRGTIKLESTVNGKSHTITLKDVVHAPDAPFNLISISRALETGIEVLFASRSVKFRAPNKAIIMEGTMLNQLFEMDIKGIIKPDLAYPAKTGKTWDKWHRIFGHIVTNL